VTGRITLFAYEVKYEHVSRQHHDSQLARPTSFDFVA